MKFIVPDAALPTVSHEVDSAQIADLDEHCFAGQHHCVTTINLKDGSVIRARASARDIRKKMNGG